MDNTDPMAALEAASNKQASEEKAAGMLSAARSQLVLGRRKDKEKYNAQDKTRMATCSFFATLGLRMQSKPDWDLPTAATDGRSLHYNPGFIAGLSISEAIGVLAHEVLHVAAMHHCRQQGRDLKRWNVAADLAINPLVLEAGFDLPKGHLYPGKRAECVSPEWADAIEKMTPGLSAEEYYAALPDEQGGDGEGDGEKDGQGDPGNSGGVKTPGDGSKSAITQAEAEARIDVAQAESMAKQRGTLPGGLGRVVEEALEPKVDWKTQLREFISRYARNDYSWSHPNRRFIAQGIYLPGLRSEELGDLVIAVDTSGSIQGEILRRFGGEIQGMLDSYDVAVTIVYHDARVCHVQQWKSSDGPLVLEAKGGGGTDHRPVFEWVTQQQLEPACMVCLTDMASCFPDAGPEYPVMWARVGSYGKAPFGSLVDVE